jgi:hypothetical protein
MTRQDMVCLLENFIVEMKFKKKDSLKNADQIIKFLELNGMQPPSLKINNFFGGLEFINKWEDDKK